MSREGSVSKAKVMKIHKLKKQGLENEEEFLFAKFTEPVSWNRPGTVRKVEGKLASVNWVTSSKMLVSKMYQLTAPIRQHWVELQETFYPSLVSKGWVGLWLWRAGQSFYLLL